MSSDGKHSSRSALLMIQVGVYLFVVGAVAVGLWWLRSDTIPAYQRRADQEQVLAQRGQARGNQSVQEYHEGEWVRVRDFAPAKTSAGKWTGLEEDSILVVCAAHTNDVQHGWLFATELGRPAALPRMVHASFVERYDPLVLEGGLELSDCRVRRDIKAGVWYYSVCGQLRNGTDRMISRCEVICHLRDSAGQPLVELKSRPLALETGGFGEFETTQAAENVRVAAFSLTARYIKAGQVEESSQVLVSLRTPREVQRERSPN